VADDDIPKLPRTAVFKVSPAAVVRIVLTASMLVMVIVATKPCANSVSKFVTDIDKTGSGSAARQMPKPGTVDVPAANGSAGDYETLRPDMTEAELKAAIERAKAKSAAKVGSGSDPSLGLGSGARLGVEQCGKAGSGSGSGGGSDCAPR
jgi:hypothetical protein